MSEGAGAPRPEPTDADRLWVVDVVAPLPPGRVRLVAADAAARLNLPAEKLVPLLENRIGPVTKPLPLRSARRVAEVLNAAGAEVDMRTARASDGPPSVVREPAPGPPGGVERRGTGRAAGDEGEADGTDRADGPLDATGAPEAEAPTPARRRRGDARPSDPWRAMSEPEGEGDADDAMLGAWRPPSAGRAARDGGAGGTSARASTSHPTEPTSTARDGPSEAAGAEQGAAAVGAHAAPAAGERDAAPPTAEEAGDARPASRRISGDRRREDREVPDPSSSPADRADDAGASDRSTGAFGEEARTSFAGGDLSGGDLERDDASVGAWTVPSDARGAPGDPLRRPPRSSSATPAFPRAASGTAASGASSTHGPSADVPSSGAASAGGTRASSAATPTPPASAPRSTYDARGATPPSVAVRDDDDEGEDDFGFGFGMRDPFAEQERRDRAVRRAVLAGALVVAVLAFLALQWAYSRPDLAGAEPPPYAVGLAAYRDGAFVSAARAWRPRAEAGDARAMFMLGYMAEIGQGRPWSNAEAAGWYRQAADRGHAPAQLRLAALYRAGMGVAHDADEALRLTLAAAAAGLPSAQLEAARLLASAGRHEEAFSWLRLAAAREPEAAGWLGLADAVRGPNRSSE